MQDAEGNKMVNEYVRKCKIGTGSFGKVVSTAMVWYRQFRGVFLLDEDAGG